MNFVYLRQHAYLITILLCVVIGVLFFTFSVGQPKLVVEIDWYDVAGEAGITLMTLIWLLFILASRPAGKVTQLFFFGLMLTHVSMLLDLLDEFFRYQSTSAWLTTIESLPAPIGMIIMTIALYQWHQEQHAINVQLRRTENYYREHSYTDFTSGLYSAAYMKLQLQRELKQIGDRQQYLSLLLLDIRQFSLFNQTYGTEQGDTLLREIAQLIQMNTRDQDVACRYANDRFIVMFPDTRANEASIIAGHIEQAIGHLAHKHGGSVQAIYPSVVTLVREYQGWHEYQTILADLNQSLSALKHQNIADVA